MTRAKLTPKARGEAKDLERKLVRVCEEGMAWTLKNKISRRYIAGEIEGVNCKGYIVLFPKGDFK